MPIPRLRRRSYFPYVLECVTIFIARLLYRVRTTGVENVPAQGGVMLISNHLSYVDVVVLQLACPRPLRFIAFKGLGKNWFFERVLRWSGVIPITSRHPTEAVRRAVKALQAGEVVCIFPEGHISRTGQLMEVKRGFEKIARLEKIAAETGTLEGPTGPQLIDLRDSAAPRTAIKSLPTVESQ